MKIIERIGRIKRELSIVEKELLANQNYRSQKLIHSIWEDKLWIKCDCKETQHAVLIPRIRNSKKGTKFHLANKVNSYPHDATCPFFSETGYDPGSTISPRKQSYCFHRDGDIEKDTREESEKTDNRKSGTRATDTLIGMIYDLYERSGLNHFTTNSRSEGWVLRKLKESAEMPFGRQFKLKDVIWVGSDNDYGRNGLLIRISKNWKQSGRPHIVQLLIAETLSENSNGTSIKTHNATFEIPIRVNRAGRVSLNKGPFLIAMTLLTEWVDKRPVFIPGRASMVPLCPETYVPVESDFERKTLSMLKRTMWGFNTNQNTRLKAYKPVKEIKFRNEYIRPDFIVYDPSFNEVILEGAMNRNILIAKIEPYQ